MRMKQTALLLSANQYSFEDDKGKTVAGCSIHYILTENLAPHEDLERQSKGYKPAKGSLPYEAYNKTQDVPGFTTLTLRYRQGLTVRSKRWSLA